MNQRKRMLRGASKRKWFIICTAIVRQIHSISSNVAATWQRGLPPLIMAHTVRSLSLSLSAGMLQIEVNDSGTQHISFECRYCEAYNQIQSLHFAQHAILPNGAVSSHTMLSVKSIRFVNGFNENYFVMFTSSFSNLERISLSACICGLLSFAIGVCVLVCSHRETDFRIWIFSSMCVLWTDHRISVFCPHIWCQITEKQCLWHIARSLRVSRSARLKPEVHSMRKGKKKIKTKTDIRIHIIINKQ